MKPKLKQLNTLGDLSPAKWGVLRPASSSETSLGLRKFKEQ
jgi:hypothetical protein